MKVIITGTTGMIGKGVLLECLEHDEVSEVLSITRSSLNLDHPKLVKLIHKDFSEFSSVGARLRGYDACFACMGVSAAGLDEDTYKLRTYDFTMALAEVLLKTNKEMTFIYVSGQGTDSSEKGRSMWARIKGKTENDLLKLGFGQAYMFRPGGILPGKGIKPSNKLYRRALFWLGWLLRVIKFFSPKSIVSTRQIGRAMINITLKGYNRSIINPVDIQILAK